MRLSRLLPLIAFALLVVLFAFGIYWSANHDTREVRSPLVGKPAPAYALPLLGDPERRVGSAELAGKPYLLNVFASWCQACRVEHPLFMGEIRRLGVPLIGFNYKDETADAKRWLAQFGDPYDQILVDYDGRVAIDFGVYGAPETFLIDANGVIRYKRIGPFTPESVESELKPAIAALGAAP